MDDYNSGHSCDHFMCYVDFSRITPVKVYLSMLFRPYPGAIPPARDACFPPKGLNNSQSPQQGQMSTVSKMGG